jgi:hypothetical protein
VRAYPTAKQTERETEKEKVRDLLIPFLLLCNHTTDLVDNRVPQPDDDETALLIEYLTLTEVRI